MLCFDREDKALDLVGYIYRSIELERHQKIVFHFPPRPLGCMFYVYISLLDQIRLWSLLWLRNVMGQDTYWCCRYSEPWNYYDEIHTVEIGGWSKFVNLCFLNLIVGGKFAVNMEEYQAFSTLSRERESRERKRKPLNVQICKKRLISRLSGQKIDWIMHGNYHALHSVQNIFGSHPGLNI